MTTMKDEIRNRMRPAHKVWEGDRLSAYICPAGKLSIGRGHNCEALPVPGVKKVGDRIDREALEHLYEEDCDRVFSQLDRYFPWWTTMGTARGAVLFDMCFNMGPGYPPKYDERGVRVAKGRGLRSFVVTLKHMETGNYSAAAKGMMSSNWAFQVGDGPGGRKDRAEIMAKQMETGEWQI